MTAHRKPRPPEVRAKISAGLKARMQDPEFREKVLQALIKGHACVKNRRGPPRTRPPKGTPESGLFETIRKALGSAAAHAELRRGENG